VARKQINYKKRKDNKIKNRHISHKTLIIDEKNKKKRLNSLFLEKPLHTQKKSRHNTIKNNIRKLSLYSEISCIPFAFSISAFALTIKNLSTHDYAIFADSS
jgi:uncharacterized membrane protein